MENPRILFVDDYIRSRIIITRLLAKNNFNNVVVVENGEEAVKMARQQSFDLFIIDMQMPVMNGFEAIEEIRKMLSFISTPIISLSSFTMKGDREKCIEVGATDFMPKPIDSEEFISKVKFYTNTLD